MLIIKFQPLGKPQTEFARLLGVGQMGILINSPLDRPDRQRVAQWLKPDAIRVDWVREFVLADGVQS